MDDFKSKSTSAKKMDGFISRYLKMLRKIRYDSERIPFVRLRKQLSFEVMYDEKLSPDTQLRTDIFREITLIIYQFFLWHIPSCIKKTLTLVEKTLCWI